jgi:hypothetical protein
MLSGFSLPSLGRGGVDLIHQHTGNYGTRFIFNGENFTDKTYSMGIAFIGDCTANDNIAINSTGTRATASNAEQPNIRHLKYHKQVNSTFTITIMNYVQQSDIMMFSPSILQNCL